MTPALTELKRLVAMLETVRIDSNGYVSISTEAGKYFVFRPPRKRPNVWTWDHEGAERHGTARTFYDVLDEIMGDIDWNTCHQCRGAHDVEAGGKFCAECLASMADAEADAADNRLATIREAGL